MLLNAMFTELFVWVRELCIAVCCWSCFTADSALLWLPVALQLVLSGLKKKGQTEISWT